MKILIVSNLWTKNFSVATFLCWYKNEGTLFSSCISSSKIVFQICFHKIIFFSRTCAKIISFSLRHILIYIDYYNFFKRKINIGLHVYCWQHIYNIFLLCLNVILWSLCHAPAEIFMWPAVSINDTQQVEKKHSESELKYGLTFLFSSPSLCSLQAGC